MKAEERLYYCLHAKSRKVQRLIDRTLKDIDAICQERQAPYCSYSSGKDSLVLLSLCQKIYPGMMTMFHDSGVELPESREIVEKAEQFFQISIQKIKSPVNVLDIYKQKGAFMEGANKDYAWTLAMMKPILAWSQHYQRDVAFIGLRKEESRQRRILLTHRGYYFYATTKQIYEAFPLAEWTAQDILAYIITQGLEELLHPAYSKTKFVNSPEKIRVSWYCDPIMIKKGYFVWLRFYYPQLFHRLSLQFPEVKHYV